MLSIYGIVSVESLSELLLEIDRKYTKTTIYLDDFKKIKLGFIINRIPLKKFYLKIKYQNDRIISLIPNFNQIELLMLKELFVNLNAQLLLPMEIFPLLQLLVLKQFTNLSRLSCLISK